MKVDGFASPYLYAGGRRCFVAADIVEEWSRRGLAVSGWILWDIAEARRDYKPNLTGDPSH